MKKFRVLIIDDDEEVISRIPKRVVIQRQSFEGKDYIVELNLLHVKIVTNNASISTISLSTIKHLANICASPFDLILSDFGFANKETIIELRSQASNGRKILKSDLIGKVLTCADLANEVIKTCKNQTLNADEKAQLLNNFINSQSKFYLYTYSSKEFYEALGEVSERAIITQAFFPNIGKIYPIDTKVEFYNGNEFDWPNESKHSLDFYSHLVSKLLNLIIQQELSAYILNDAKRLKYLRAPRSLYSVAVIVALAGAIGAFSEWIGAQIFKLATNQEVVTAILFAVLTIIVIFIIGLLLPKIFEHSISSLLSEDENFDHANKKRT